MTTEKAVGLAMNMARKTAKPRTITDILTALSVCLTFLSMIPYQLGDAATIISPEWKGRLVLIGTFSTVALQVIRPYLPSPNQPKNTQ